MIKGKRILVTGSAGSIGSEIVRQLAPRNSVFLFDINETGTFDLYEELKLKGYKVDYRIGDIRNKKTVKEVFNKFDIVFHAAALKHVSPSERYPREVIETNLLGLVNVLEETKGKFIFISSDKAVNSSSIMGISKKFGEIVVRNAGGVVVRFGNVLGARGSVIPLWQESINRGENLNVTDERMTRFFMTTQEAVSLVIEAAEKAKPKETYILDMGKPINILALAKEVIRRSGKEVGINMIGIRPGETLDEKLMTEEEEKRAIKRGRFFIL